ncbi:hypothetical protein F5Y11DRAFT_331436 [Daldinia sp. FL1419]|nr:hypothetical protein F5Y11DRAFT_331436 [Daldinia sp. FL1419]
MPTSVDRYLIYLTLGTGTYAYCSPIALLIGVGYLLPSAWGSAIGVVINPRLYWLYWLYWLRWLQEVHL